MALAYLFWWTSEVAVKFAALHDMTDVANVVFSVTEYMTHVTGQDFIVDGGKILNS